MSNTRQLKEAKKLGRRQQVPIDKVRVGVRHRKDIGDLVPLADSMRELGQLQPLVLRPDYTLIAGERRLQAAVSLGWREVSAVVIDGLQDAILALRAERDENTCRKDFTPSEAVAIGKALEELERPRAAQRQARAGPKKGRGKKLATASGNLPAPLAPMVADATAGDQPPPDTGRTRDKVADAVGMSPRTYEKAKVVVEAAEQEPEKFAPVKEEMDQTGKVDPAYRTVRENTHPSPRPKTEGIGPVAWSGLLSQLDRLSRDQLLQVQSIIERRLTMPQA